MNEGEEQSVYQFRKVMLKLHVNFFVTADSFEEDNFFHKSEQEDPSDQCKY